MGYEIAKYANSALPGNVVRNLYTQHFIKLQPVLSNSFVLCPFCSPKTNFYCNTCKRTGYVESTNCYRLSSVWNPDKTKNTTKFDQLLVDPRRQIRETSLLTFPGQLKHLIVPVEFPQGNPPPRLSKDQLKEILRDKLNVEHHIGQIIPINKNDLRQKVVKMTPTLQTFFIACLARSVMLAPEIEVYRIRKKPFERVLRIKLIGERSTYCPEKKTCVNRNHTEMWIVLRDNHRAYIKCSTCTNFHTCHVNPSSHSFREELARLLAQRQTL